jgi:hypothetical protein
MQGEEQCTGETTYFQEMYQVQRVGYFSEEDRHGGRKEVLQPPAIKQDIHHHAGAQNMIGKLWCLEKTVIEKPI